MYPEVGTSPTTFYDFCFHRHDVEVNQKYDKVPYSFHLNAVMQQVEYYYPLVPKSFITKPKSAYLAIAAGHDLIEDARLTYNDIVSKLQAIQELHNNANFIAEGIFACTEVRGRNRHERHSEEFIQSLKECPQGIFVKLCDIVANSTYGLLTRSGMYKKYQQEYSKLHANFYSEDTRVIFKDLKTILAL